MNSPRRKIRQTLGCILTILTLLSGSAASLAGEASNPLAPADTSSPHETLRGFLETLNAIHARIQAVVKSYFGSSRLYVSKQEHAEIDRLLEELKRVRRTLDLSEVPAALADKVADARMLQLKEVLDRIELPPIESVPDAEAMHSAEFKRWTLPGTEITIARVEQGPRAGEYLFSPETVQRAPEFYERVRHLPYTPGATKGWYESYRYGGGGLYKAIPYRWMIALPDWAKQRILDQPVWRWFGVMLVFLVAAGTYLVIRRFAGFWAARNPESELRAMWARLSLPVALLVIIPVLVHVLGDNLRISGLVLEITTLSLWAVFTLALTWSVWLGVNVIAESVVSSQQLLHGSIDSQLIRLGLRLVATVLSIAILVIGAQQLGIPAYSVIAGLGVGGIAVALAAKDSLANLLGSLLIMFEKPFRVGHWIKVEGTEGFVESIGFRSTRIRTFHNSLVSIPSNQLVNSTVDNMAMRRYRGVRTVLRIDYETPAETVERFVESIKEIVLAGEYTWQQWFRIRLDDFGEYGLHILVNFFLEVPDMKHEQAERQRILLEILKLAERMDIQFAVAPLPPPEEAPAT